MLKKLNIAADILNTNIAEAKTSAHTYQAIICPENLADTFAAAQEKGTAVIALKNLLDEKEIERKIGEAGLVAVSG